MQKKCFFSAAVMSMTADMTIVIPSSDLERTYSEQTNTKYDLDFNQSKRLLS